MATDSELLRAYAGEHTETAFAELVRRHLDLVYGVTLRRVGGDSQLAEDVTQQVFLALAQNATVLATRATLSGWLYATARNLSAQTVRAEQRRRAREHEAHIMQQLGLNEPTASDWARLHPLIDEALDKLSETDREAVLLRFSQGCSFAEVGAALRTSEDAARVRVARALDKLQVAVVRAGITSTPAALATVFTNATTAAAPAGLAATVTGAVISQVTATGVGATATGIFAMTKLQIGIIAAALLTGAGGYVLQARRIETLRTAVTAAQLQQREVALLRVENRQLAATVAEVEALRHDDNDLKQLAGEIAQAQRTARAAAEPSSIRLGPSAAAGSNQSLPQLSEKEGVTLHLPDADLSATLRAFEMISGRKVVRDPSLAPVRGTVNIDSGTVTAPQALSLLRRSLREQLNVVVEPAADGTFMAKRGGTP